MNQRPDFRDIFMSFARELSRRSSCERLQVGCVITTADNRQVVALGYNGGAAGGRNDCKRDAHGVAQPGQCGHLHAEINAIISCAHQGHKNVYITHLPCEMCAIALVNLSAAQGRIHEVYFEVPYRDSSGCQVLADAGIHSHRLLPPGSTFYGSKGLDRAIHWDTQDNWGGIELPSTPILQ